MNHPENFPGSHFMRTPPPHGFGIRFTRQDDGVTVARFTLDADKEGPPGYAHGGAVAAILDEVMGAAAYHAGRLGYTVTMTVNYHASVPLGVEVETQAQVDRIDGKHTHVTGSIILPDGKIAADSSGVFRISTRLYRLFAERGIDITDE